MNDFPRLALAVRQPWAWAIINGGKDVENRDWGANNPGLRFRGRVAIHASAGLTKDEYFEAREFIAARGVMCPPAAELLRGGIIGTVEVCDIISKFPSPWFVGPKGLLLRKPKPCEFIPAKGQLSYYEWRPGDPDDVPPAARWMLPVETPAPTPSTRDLFGDAA